MQTSAECYIAGDRPAPFLRLETRREQMALPYAMLLGLALSLDENTLELDFASHKVTVTGKRLYEIFCAISAGQSQALLARGAAEEFALGPASKAPFIQDIRIKPVEAAPP